MSDEAFIQFEILKAWGANPRLRFARCNTGVGWFAKGKPARKTDPDAYPVRFNPEGTADIVGLMAPSGRMLMIEVKGPKGKQSDSQKKMQAVVTRFGGLYVVARSVSDVDQALAAVGITR